MILFFVKFVMLLFISLKLLVCIADGRLQLAYLMVQLFLTTTLLLCTLFILISQVLQFNLVFCLHGSFNLILDFHCDLLCNLLFDLLRNAIGHLLRDFHSCHLLGFLDLQVYHELSQV